MYKGLKVQCVKYFRKPGIQGSLPDSVFRIEDIVGLASLNTKKWLCKMAAN